MSKLPKWVEEAAKWHIFDSGHYALHEPHASNQHEAFIAGAQLVLDRLEATRKADLLINGSAPTLEAQNKGRESVRREVLEDNDWAKCPIKELSREELQEMYPNNRKIKKK